jgi:cysteine desulfuration protein SufE
MSTTEKDIAAINDAQDELIEAFAFFDDWMEKYEHLIGLGKELPLIDQSQKTEDLLIKGCQSKVWLHAELVDGKLIFTADSDAIITRGIISTLIQVLSHRSPAAVASCELYFIDKIGLKEHLSPTRSNGLMSMVKQMKFYALAYQAKQQQDQ